MKTLKEKIAELIEPIVTDNGAYLIDVVTSSLGQRNFVKIILQSMPGITMDEITRITRAINSRNLLDELFPDGYHLEVSSPGIDYKLRDYRDFPRNIGRMLRVYHQSSSFPSPLSGVLREVTTECLTLEVGGTLRILPLGELDYAQVIIKW